MVCVLFLWRWVSVGATGYFEIWESWFLHLKTLWCKSPWYSQLNANVQHENNPNLHWHELNICIYKPLRVGNLKFSIPLQSWIFVWVQINLLPCLKHLFCINSIKILFISLMEGLEISYRVIKYFNRACAQFSIHKFLI